VEIATHLAVTALSIISIWGIEEVLCWVGLDGKPIPFTSTTLADWMFVLEVFAATLIISIGIAKAAIALVRS
jgi:hypothetical protein